MRRIECANGRAGADASTPRDSVQCTDSRHPELPTERARAWVCQSTVGSILTTGRAYSIFNLACFLLVGSSHDARRLGCTHDHLNLIC